MDISGSLNLPPSHVYGVATFYSFFKFKQPGQHIVTSLLRNSLLRQRNRGDNRGC